MKLEENSLTVSGDFLPVDSDSVRNSVYCINIVCKHKKDNLFEYKISTHVFFFNYS